MSRVRTALAVAAGLLGGAAGTAQPPADTGGFTLPEDRDAKQRLTAVTDYLGKTAVPWDVVCATAQQLLDGRSDSFTVLPKAGRVSVKGRVNELLGGLPKDGRQFYELTYGPQAAALLKEATAKGYDRAKLADVAQRYFHTRAGAQAAVLLASLRLDAGDAPEAADGFRRLLARPDAGEFETPALLARAAAAYKRTRDPRLAAEADKLLDRLERAVPAGGLALGRATYPADRLRAEADRPPAAPPGRAADETAGRYGNPAHTGRGAGGVPFLDPAFSVPLLYRADDGHKDGADWVRHQLDSVYKQLDKGKGQLVLPGFFPVTVPGLAVYRGYDAVYAVATRDGYAAEGVTYQAGQVVWLSPMSYGGQALYGGSDRAAARQMEEALRGFWRQMPSVLVENTQAGALSHDGKRVYCVDDWAVPPAPPQFAAGNFNPNPVGGQPVRGAGEASRLYAIDLSTGKLAWWLGGPADAPAPADEQSGDASRLTENALFLGPPLAAAGKLYALFERDGQVSLACLDPDRLRPTAGPDPRPQPELVWVQPLGAPATKLAADPLRRTQACFPAFADGVLVCPTHAKAVVAVDVNARTLLWARGYADPADPDRAVGEGGPIGLPGRGGFRGNPRGFNPMPGGAIAVPADRWRAAAPIIAGGKVVLAAPDADQLQCLDLRTGGLVWAEPRRPDDVAVGGVADGVVLVVGKAGVRAVRLDGAVDGKPAEAWPAVAAGSPVGHGTVAADGRFYLPLAGGGDGPGETAEPQVWAIEIATGAVKARAAFRRPDPTADPRRTLGNLLFHDGLLLAQSADALTAFPLLGLKRDEMTRLLNQNPTDPRGLLLRGELALDAGDARAAVADLRAAAAHDPPADVRRTLRQKLYSAYTEVLRADFPAAEPHLAEYERLCEEVPDATDPAKAADETARRRRVYLSLLARGREKQGKAAEAAAAYRGFAALGDGEPVAMPGEPVGKVRPEVWAAGRLADLLAAAPADDRARLTEPAEAEWRAVRAADDLPRLRRFAAGYEGYGAVGRAAALELAGRLLATGDPADRREAFGRLVRLTADPDPAARAAATARLAAALAAAGQAEHAVGLYARLGGEFGRVPVGDGGTGGDRLAALLADRRLLAGLEPSRPPLAGRYTVEAQNAPPGLGLMAATRVRVEGDLLPSLRAVQLTIQPGGNGDNRGVLVASDRRTGGELFRVADLQQPAGAGGPFGGPAAEPVALASGHLVLLVLGTHAHCLDLLEKKEAWRYPLLGRGRAAAAPAVTQAADGDAEYSYDDGFKLRLARAAVLRPGYAALVTRDGLVCLDPATRAAVRWERADVAPRVQVWGDDRHLFLVEAGADGGRTSRVLRAADGAAVPGVPDFAAAFSGPGRRAVLGRHLLLESGTGAGRKLRLLDPLTGADVWARDLPADAHLFDSPTPGLTGYLTRDGRAVVLDAPTGKVLLDAVAEAGDRRLLAGTVDKPLLLADADRFYLFRNRSQAGGGQLLDAGAGAGVRQKAVNGVGVCFDRGTGKPHWHSDRLFLGRLLVTDRFDELPALVTVTDAPVERPGEAAAVALTRVEVVDKATGRVRFHQGGNAAGPFLTTAAAPKTQAVELVRAELRLRLVPDAGR